MPRVAPPKDGDLPVFPSAQQYHGTTEVHTQRRAPSTATPSIDRQRSIPQANAAPRHEQTQRTQRPPQQREPPSQYSRQQRPGHDQSEVQYASYRSAPAGPTQERPPRSRAYTPENRSAPTGDLRRMNLNLSSPDSDHGASRRPVLGIQGSEGRRTPQSANFVGQPFGIVPEDTSRAPPYDPVLWKLFCQVDSDGSGAITQSELAHALINGDFTPFHIDTVAFMIRLFDDDRNGTISFSEFEKLWKYLLEWRSLFSQFDSDLSGTISFPEFSEALAAFGYRLTTSFVQFLFRHHDKNRTKEMTFDLFVQSCVTLKLFTDIFRKFDTDLDGIITIGFEDFLKVMIRNR